MASCAPFHDHILDLVFGLLDESEAQAIHAHVDTCPRCQEALAEGQIQQRLFAQAALAVRADAVPAFVAPAEAAPARRDEAPATLPFPAPVAPRRRAPRRGLLLAWSAAAAVLVACGVLWHLYSQETDSLHETLAEQRQTVTALETQLAALEPRFQAEAHAIHQKLRTEAPLHLYAMAPTHLHPGADEVVQVAVQDLDGRPITAKLAVSLVDPAASKVLARHDAVATNGVASVPIGAAQAVLQGHAEVRLVVEATAGPATARVQETLKVAAPTYIAHLITNKSVCRPGELLFFRALLLDRAGLTPPAVPVALRFTLTDAAGKTVADTSAQANPGSGVAAGELAVLDQWVDGEYELRVAALPATATAVRPHARKLQIARGVTYDAQADQQLYRAGQVVNLGLPRALADAKLEKKVTTARSAMDVKVLVNGQQVPLLNQFPGNFGGAFPMTLPEKNPSSGVVTAPPQGGPAVPASQSSFDPANAANQSTNGLGGYFRNERAYTTNLQFALPKDLDTNRVRVKIVLTEGKVQETFEQDLAVVPSALAVDFFPEGGDLVAGVANRVFFRVRSPRGEPVSPEGRVIVLSGTDVLFDSAPGQGTGSFTFIPKAGDVYSARLTTADGPTREFANPFARLGGIRADGIVLHTPQPVAVEGEPLQVVLRNPGLARRVLLVAQCRGRFVGQQWVDAKGPAVTISLGTLAGAHGIIRVTAYEANGETLKPLAERLVYRLPSRRLDLAVLHLGGIVAHNMGPKSVQLELRARDEQGEPTPAWVLAAVVDERFRTPEASPATHFFMAGDARSGADLDNAALLAADTPAAREALDHFLGTAGWRRFDSAADQAVAAVPADAVFLGRENGSPKAQQAQYEARLEEALTPIRLALQHEQAELGAAQQAARSQLDRIRITLRDHEGRPEEVFRIGLGVATILLLGLAAVVLTVGAYRLVRRHQATPFFAGAFASLALCLVTTLVLSSLAPPPNTDLGSVAQGPQHDPTGVLGRLNFPHPVDVPQSLPVGAFAPTAPHERAAAKAVAKVIAADAQTALRSDKHGRRQDGALDNFGGAAWNRPEGQAEAKNKEAGRGLAPELALRYKKAVAEQMAHVAKASAAKPIAPPPGPNPNPAAAGGGKQTPGMTGSAALKGAKELERSRRGVFYASHFQPGLEADTLLWDPALFLPAGAAQVAFDVPSAAGAYRVLLIGHTADGRLGFYEGNLQVQTDLSR